MIRYSPRNESMRETSTHFRSKKIDENRIIYGKMNITDSKVI